MAERGVIISYESVRRCCAKFGPEYVRRTKKRLGSRGDVWYLDEMVVTIQGERYLLWRAVDQDGDVLDILVQKRNDKRAAKRFFRKLLKGQGQSPNRMVTDKLPSYRAARNEMMSHVPHSRDRYSNNRAEVSHEQTRAQQRQMRGFRSPGQTQRFLNVHSQVHNLFRLGRHHTARRELSHPATASLRDLARGD